MYMFMNALVMAMLLPASGAGDPPARPGCSAELVGLDLLTTAELPTGVVVQAPWRITHRAIRDDDTTVFVMFAVLDRVIERDQLTGDRNIVPFPEPVRLVFEGATQTEVVNRAAQVWCVTVMRAQENQALDRVAPEQALHTRIAARMRSVLHV